MDPQKKLDLDILNELEELFSKVEETAERLHYINTDLEMQERNWKSVYNLKIHEKLLQFCLQMLEEGNLKMF